VRGLSGQVDWTLGGGNTLTSITAYRTREVGPN
jgi:iron complex outermembrane receptor protein